MSPLREGEVKIFYTSLWGASSKIHIPFTTTSSSREALDLGSTFQAVTTRDINERISRTRKGTAPGPNGIQRKHKWKGHTRNIVATIQRHPGEQYPADGLECEQDDPDPKTGEGSQQGPKL